ncbi:hypothetical protein I7I51_02829 [Histoplasma capsulatum]|uniref:Uncharacterized protein n=1 Tax=Ajellomyces capsulatus TaxID=5037 RepID=A0A8A1MN75_AJECA|nr:hypothetical protein I7I51_02829 [Histoplasma capsulatum]
MEARVKWEMEKSKYNNDRNIYEDKLAGVSKIRQEIFRTVAFSELEIATNGNSCIDVKDLLLALKKRLSPRTADRQYEAPKQNLDQWLDAWTLNVFNMKLSNAPLNFSSYKQAYFSLTILQPAIARLRSLIQLENAPFNPSGERNEIYNNYI